MNTTHTHAAQTATVAINKLRKGDYFQLPGKDRVYVYDGYCRFTLMYSAFRFDDINHFIYKKKNTLVVTDFEF
jgi:hypothetical protein